MRVVLVGAILFVFTALGTALATFESARQEFRASLLQFHRADVGNLAAQLDAHVASREDLLKGIAEKLASSGLTAPALRQTLDAGTDSTSMFGEEIVLADEHGHVLLAPPSKAILGGLKEVGAESWFLKLAAARRPVVSPSSVIVEGEKVLYVVAAPIMRAGHFAGAVAAPFRLMTDPAVLRIFANVSTARHWQIVASDGHIVASLPEKMPVGTGVLGTADMVDTSEATLPQPGGSPLVASAELSRLDWTVFAAAPMGKMGGFSAPLATKALIWALFFCAVAVLTLRAVAVRALAPVEAASMEIRRRLNGEQQSAEPLPVHRNDEVGTLIHGFNELQARLVDSDSRFNQVFEFYPDMVIVNDLVGGQFIEANRAFETAFGWPRSELLGMTGQRTRLWVGSYSLKQYLRNLVEHGAVSSLSAQFRCRDGRIVNTLLTGCVIDYRGRPGVISVIKDVTALTRANEQLLLADHVFQGTAEGILITDENNQIIRVNRAFTRVTGFEPEQALGRNPSILASGMHQKEFYQDMWDSLRTSGYWQGEVWNKRRNGEVYPELLCITALTDEQDRVTNYVAQFSDVSRRKRDEEQINKLAYFDALTELPNKLLLRERVDQAIRNATLNGRQIAILFVDLDRFKYVNDSFGHAAGDLLLKSVAKTLLGCVRESDTVARTGGDEFVLVLPDVHNALEAAKSVAEKCVETLSRPVDVSGHEIHTSPSIGIAIFPHHGRDFEDLTKSADIAMYRAKEEGKNTYRVYEHDTARDLPMRLMIEHDLRHAIENNELVVCYQPKVETATGAIVGAEALIRWRHPTRGLIPPGVFIPIAEEIGIIDKIGEWVLHEACGQNAKWIASGLWDCAVAVNISAVQLREPLFPEHVWITLQKTKLEARHLELEITETLLVGQHEKTLGIFMRLKELGVSLAIDDFGVGYSSLSYLKTLPVDWIKIDQSFVMDLLTDKADRAIVNAILAIGPELGMSVVAEGIESLEHYEYLRERGCHVIQGFHISKPMPAGEFEHFVRNWGADSRAVA